MNFLRGVFYGCLLVIVCGGCVSSAPPPRPLDLPFSKYFDQDFKTVWDATIEVLDNYQIVRVDRDAGLLETDWTESRFNRALYDPPPDYKEFFEAVKYRLKVKVSKLRNKQSGLPAASVQIVKELMEGRTFIYDYDRIPTDRVEEQVILYRIGQRVEIMMRLKRKAMGASDLMRDRLQKEAPTVGQ